MPADNAAQRPGAHRKLLLDCQCVGSCAVLGVDDWGDVANHPDDPPWSWSFEFYSRAGSGPGTLRYRLRLAWQIIRGQDHFLECVCLDGDDLLKLRSFIDESLPPRITDTNWTATA